MAEVFKGFHDLGKALGIEKQVSINQQRSQTFQGDRERGGYQQNNRSYQGSNTQSRPQEQPKINDPDYVNRAEKVMLSIGRPDNRDSSKRRFNLTTSKIRGILTLFNQIYNDVVKSTDEKLTEDMQNRIKYLRVRMVYEAGREPSVEEFISASDLLTEVNRIGDSKKKFIELARYMEALVAYHRFLGGRDN